MGTISAIRQKVLDIARAQIGITENPHGSNRVIYNTWFYNYEVRDGIGLDGKPKKDATYAWCGTFVSWVFFKAGISLGNIGYLRGYASCPYALKNVSKWGKIIAWDKALPGDIMFIDFDGNGTFDHTGIFEEHTQDKKSALFIEGNTGIPKSAADFKNANANGGIVMRRGDRSYVEGRIVIVRPNVYNEAA